VKLLRPALLSCLVIGCSMGKPRAPNTVTITATDFAFGAPDTIPAGLTTFTMDNRGKEPHQAVIAGGQGKTFAELETTLLKEGPIPDWLTFPAGPGAAIGGDSSNATADIPAGNYLILCFIPSPDGTMHVMKGMLRRLVVIPSSAARAAEPQADVTVKLSDYDFAFSTPLTAGTHTIRIENDGPQLHELAIERLAPGKTFNDWLQWGATGMKGPPVALPVGGFVGPDKGKVGWMRVTLTPGTYLINCYVPDAKDGKPHFMHGMVREITVS
jgi:hypothetical protein